MTEFAELETEVILYEKNLKEHCEVAALILRTLPSTSPTRHYVNVAIRQASHQVSSVRGGNNHIKASYMSVAAEAQMKSGSFDGLVAEHLVPVKILVHKVFAMDPTQITWQKIREVVVQFSKMALITKLEDEQLRLLGFTARMPENWDGVDLFARYENTSIELKKNSYSFLRRDASGL